MCFVKGWILVKTKLIEMFETVSDRDLQYICVKKQKQAYMFTDWYRYNFILSYSKYCGF